ncbi:hypothetical protein Tco_0860889 [Tanacetum coccineum]|uniref:Uncharacterized protein n=1 Tax=Tanacetum coccineum TaxID=301880 RepID=A0ABQ5BIF6_9ASTR
MILRVTTAQEVILNGNKALKRTVGEVKQEYEPTSVEEKHDRRNEMKARGTLLMALPNKDQLKLNQAGKQRKDSALTEPTTEETPDEAHVSTPSCDASQSEVTLMDETQEMNDDNLMFDTDVLEEQEKDVAKKEVSTVDPVTTAGETLIEFKTAKPKVVTSVATITTTTRPKARGVVVQEPSKFKTKSSSLQASQLPQAKDKGKGIMVEPKVSLKKKDQLALDEEMTRNLEAQLQAELIKKERIARQKE